MTYTFRKKEYEYFDHPGNQTRVNERRMELPIGFEFAIKHPNLLEVGNVTRHYHREFTHDVIDLYEKSAWPIMNEDILTFTPPKKYEAVLSISTVEHTTDTKKAIQNIINLSPKFLITVPFGYSTTKDILSWDFPMYFMTRKNDDNEWEQVTKSKIKNKEYGKPFPFANTVAIITNE